MSGADCGKACCGCCEGTGGATPVFLENRPGLSALAYRVGTHALFKEAMLAAISAPLALRALTTRADDDPTIALLDAWAVTLDVLTFYQERIANEGFLRTATERRSLLELARTIGYELRPGVASSTWLAFTLDGSPGSPREVTIPAGTRAQSLPTKSELPQTFETGEALLARPEWNALRPRLLMPQPIAGTEALLAGLATQLRPGDALLFVGANPQNKDPNDPQSKDHDWDLRILNAVEPRPEAGVTRVAWQVALTVPSSPVPRIYALRQRAALFGANAPDWKAMSVDFKKEYVPLATNPPETYNPSTHREWPGFAAKMEPNKTIDLDATYLKIAPSTWVVVAGQLSRVVAVETVFRGEFTLSSRVTRLTLDATIQTVNLVRRETAVFVESEELAPALQPIAEPIKDKTIELDGLVEGLVPGRAIVVQGTAENGGPDAAEAAFLEAAAPAPDMKRTILTLAEPLADVYDRTTVAIYANVAPATHGETWQEVLGGGNAAKRFQRFRLRQKPLTYVAAPVPGGGESTLELRVNGVRWHEAPDLYGLGPRDRKYVLRRDDEGTTSVLFGDGVHGARLPTGVENVEAVYRTGIGLPGLVGESRIALLPARPLGVRSVANPVPASGAADPETRDQARRNAPMTVLTLDRVVSLHDFEDFARSFSGIGKAQARALWQRGRQLVHLTLAGADGGPVGEKTALFTNLREALNRLRDPFQPLVIDSFDQLLFRARMRVKVDPDFVKETVLAPVESALRAAFSFAARDFGQSVFLSEVMAVAQGVEGVVYVDVDALYLEGSAATLEDRLLARPARIDDTGQIARAQMLLLSPQPVAPEAIL